jgi:glycosyltransferase involved in cell wall biosynthesis
MNNKLAIIVPVYNEEEMLQHSNEVLSELLTSLINKNKISNESYILFVNDGSSDSSWNIITSLAKNNNQLKGLSLSRNFGQQNATICGFMEAEADIYVSIDVDLQDDVSKIEEMVDEYHKGSDIVYGVLLNRDTDTFFKKWSSITYYKFLKYIGIKVIPNHSQFRLLSKNAIEKLKLFTEKNMFLRGIIPLIGLKSSKVYYNRFARQFGKTKYNTMKLVRLAINEILSFSDYPLRFITFIAAIFLIISIIMFAYVLFAYVDKNIIKGWASIIASIYLVGGLVLISLGIIAQYVSKIFIETKNRPLYIVGEQTDNLKA